MDTSVTFLHLNMCHVINALLWIKYWLMWFESLSDFILFQFKNRPNFSRIWVVYITPYIYPLQGGIAKEELKWMLWMLLLYFQTNLARYQLSHMFSLSVFSSSIILSQTLGHTHYFSCLLGGFSFTCSSTCSIPYVFSLLLSLYLLCLSVGLILFP